MAMNVRLCAARSTAQTLCNFALFYNSSSRDACTHPTTTSSCSAAIATSVFDFSRVPTPTSPVAQRAAPRRLISTHRRRPGQAEIHLLAQAPHWPISARSPPLPCTTRPAGHPFCLATAVPQPYRPK